MSVSAFDHPVLGTLLGDAEIAQFFSFDADLAAMLAFERALAEAQALIELAREMMPAERVATRETERE